MKAVVIERYGSPEVLRLKADVEMPVLRSRQILIEAYASSVNPIDWKIRNGSLRLLLGWRFPKILGFDVSGRVAAVGSEVRKFKPGDLVYAKSDAPTGGAYAEYVAVGESAAARKPQNLSHEEAAAIPLAALTAYQGFQWHAPLKSGAEVLITGASGGVGSFAVQIAKIFQARVTGVCGPKNADLVKRLGADEVLDYEKQPIFGTDRSYDVIFDAAATCSFSQARRCLKDRGAYVSTLPSFGLMAAWLRSLLLSSRKAAFILMKPRGEDLETITRWVESGKLKPVLDSVFPLEQVRQAHERSQEGHPRGKIVLRIKPGQVE